MNNDVTKLTDLELAKALSMEQDALSQSVHNVNILKMELNKRLEATKKEAQSVGTV